MLDPDITPTMLADLREAAEHDLGLPASDPANKRAVSILMLIREREEHATLVARALRERADPATGRPEPTLRHFDCAHLPPGLAVVSHMFADLAGAVVVMTPACAERSACLRKILEGKDCAVRAAREGGS